MCFLTALLSSFLMVDLPHRALTPSTATARRKFDSGCPLCSLSSFITAPTTSLLLFTRVIPYSKKKGHQKPDHVKSKYRATPLVCLQVLKSTTAYVKPFVSPVGAKSDKCLQLGLTTTSLKMKAQQTTVSRSTSLLHETVFSITHPNLLNCLQWRGIVGNTDARFL